MRENAHSELPPSSAGIWGSSNGCRGWRAMMKAIPSEPDTPATREGETAHALAARWLHSCKNSGAYHEISAGIIGEVCESTRMRFNQEMLINVAEYVKYIAATITDFRTLHIEDPLDMPMMGHDVYGTSDAWSVVGGTLHVFDLKYGHTPVDAIGNMQLVCYAAGALHSLGATASNITEVHLHISQPRSYHKHGINRVWKLVTADFHPLVNELAKAAMECRASDAKLRTGSHCRWCDARMFCPAALETAMCYYETVVQTELTYLGLKEKTKLFGVIERGIEALRTLHSALETELVESIKSGKVVDGYQMKPSYGYLSWTKPAVEIFALGGMMGIDLDAKKPVTPTQAIKLGFPKDSISKFAERELKGYTLEKIKNQELHALFGGTNG